MTDYYGGRVISKEQRARIADVPQPASILDRIRNWIGSPSPDSTAGLLRDAQAKTDAEIDKQTK